MNILCDCGKGYGSSVDGLCRFCRENLVPRSQAKAVGVRHRGDGMSVEEYQRTATFKTKKRN